MIIVMEEAAGYNLWTIGKTKNFENKQNYELSKS